MDLSQYIDDMAHYLASDRWLPFVSSTRYLVRKPFAYFPSSDKRYCVFTLMRKPDHSQEAIPFGHVQVIPCFQEGHIRITHLQSCYDHVRDQINVRGVGREVVRRLVLRAREMGCQKVTTSHCLNGASSFWLNIGFGPEDQLTVDWSKIKPDWSQVTNVSKEEIAAWKARLEQSADTIRELARTRYGREALYWQGSKGVLDFNNGRQCRYAFGRLKLPYNHE